MVHLYISINKNSYIIVGLKFFGLPKQKSMYPLITLFPHVQICYIFELFFLFLGFYIHLCGFFHRLSSERIVIVWFRFFWTFENKINVSFNYSLSYACILNFGHRWKIFSLFLESYYCQSTHNCHFLLIHRKIMKLLNYKIINIFWLFKIKYFIYLLYLDLYRY